MRVPWVQAKSEIVNKFPTFSRLGGWVSVRARWFTTEAGGLNWVRVLSVVGGLAFVLFVWPTPYRYFKGGSTNYRVNRFTGSTETLRGGGWR